MTFPCFLSAAPEVCPKKKKSFYSRRVSTLAESSPLEESIDKSSVLPHTDHLVRKKCSYANALLRQSLTPEKWSSVSPPQLRSETEEEGCCGEMRAASSFGASSRGGNAGHGLQRTVIDRGTWQSKGKVSWSCSLPNKHKLIRIRGRLNK